MNIRELRAMLAARRGAAAAYLDGIIAQGRGLTDDEKAQAKANQDEIDGLVAAIEAREQLMADEVAEATAQEARGEEPAARASVTGMHDREMERPWGPTVPRNASEAERIKIIGIGFGEQLTASIANRTHYSLCLNDEDLNTRLAV